MADVANQVHSTPQQSGARIGWNPIDAATQPPAGTRDQVDGNREAQRASYLDLPVKTHDP